VEHLFKINRELKFSENHLINTNRGFVNANDLTVNDKLINFEGGFFNLSKIIRCGKRPNALIIGSFEE